MDTQVQLQALLDGALWRVTLRELAGPLAAAAAVAAALAMQEFAVYEPTGISVVATEVRMVFETGAFSSADNPITQQMGFGGSADSRATMQKAEGLQSLGDVHADQSARAGAAVATSIPLLALIA